jgi:hypothetical protein
MLSNSLYSSIILEKLNGVQILDLERYIRGFNFEERADARRALATAHGRSIGSIYKWNSRQSHPTSPMALSRTEQWSDCQVTRFDLRPDMWQLTDVIDVLTKMGYEISKPCNEHASRNQKNQKVTNER